MRLFFRNHLWGKILKIIIDSNVYNFQEQFRKENSANDKYLIIFFKKLIKIGDSESNAYG